MEICDNCALAAGGLELLLSSSCVDHHDPFMPIYGDIYLSVSPPFCAHIWAYMVPLTSCSCHRDPI